MILCVWLYCSKKTARIHDTITRESDGRCHWAFGRGRAYRFFLTANERVATPTLYASPRTKTVAKDLLCVAKDETSVDIMCRMFCCNFLRKNQLWQIWLERRLTPDKSTVYIYIYVMYGLGTLSFVTIKHNLNDVHWYIIASDDEILSRRPLR
jgi:hypothetical protein